MMTEGKSARRLRAVEQGATDRSGGLDIDNNPYRKSDWGLGGFWEIGYYQQIERERLGMARAHPRFVKTILCFGGEEYLLGDDND